jgi:hypothetical protein
MARTASGKANADDAQKQAAPKKRPVVKVAPATSAARPPAKTTPDTKTPPASNISAVKAQEEPPPNDPAMAPKVGMPSAHSHALPHSNVAGLVIHI